MKKIIFFVSFALIMFFPVSFGQAPLPILSGHGNLITYGVALSDTAQEGKSFRFDMNTSIPVGSRYAKWDLNLSQNITFPRGTRISANVMIPMNSGDVQISLTLLNGNTIVMNSALYVISRNSSSGVSFHRQSFQFPEMDANFNKVRFNLSYLQNQSGPRTIFFDGIYMINGIIETLVDNCNGGTGITGIGDKNSTPTKFDLLQNYPNPFNPSTKISFSLPSSSPVKISVFDISGKEIRMLKNEEFSGGTHSISFDGEGMASGMYFYTIQTKFGQLSKKMLLMK